MTSAEPDREEAPSRSHWLLLRGLAREARHWGSFPDILSGALRDAGHDAVIETLDLPGTGTRSDETAPFSIEATAVAVRAHWSAGEGARSPATQRYLLAMSLGGMVANAWTTHWPDDFTGCVVINTSLRGYAPFHQRLRPSAYGKLVSILFTTDDDIRERAIVSLISNRAEIQDATARDWAALARSCPMHRAAIIRQLWAAATYRPRRPALSPLILASHGDRLVDPACSQAIAARWQSELRLHPDAGHDLALDDPAWIAAQICAWLEARAHP